MEGVKRKLVGIEIVGEPVGFNMTRWPASQNGEQVGHVTSAIYSPRLERNIAYANIPIEMTKTGTKLSVMFPDDSLRSALVVPKPFIDPKKEIPKS